MKSLAENSLIKIAKIVDAHGLKGEFKVHFFSGEPLQSDFYTLKLGEETFSFKVIKLKNAVLKLAGIDDRTHAEGWIGAEIFVDEKNFQSKKGEAFFLRELLGFEVYDNDKTVGVVEGFESNNSQDILQVKTSEGDRVLIPLIKEFTVLIDSAEKKIKMKLPPGLLEVNR